MRLRLRAIRPAGWWFDGLLVGAFAALTWALAAGAFLGWDLAVRDWVDAHQRFFHWIAWTGNYLGQGTPLTALCLLLALFRAGRGRTLWPVLAVVAAFVLTYGTLTPLKDATDRAAPHTWSVPHPERFGSGGNEYPSGHVTNAIVWYGILALLLSPWLSVAWRRAIRVAPPAILSVTTVYLGYHWLTDTVAGLLLGLFLDRLLRRVPWEDLRIRVPVRQLTDSRRDRVP